MHKGMGRGFTGGFDDDPFNDDFFNDFGINETMQNNGDRNNNFEEEEPKTKTSTYVMDGKKIKRTEEPYYENDGTLKTLVREENEDGEVVEYFE